MKGTKKTKSYTLKQEILLPRKVVWELLANTDQLNRIIGLMPVQFSNVIKDHAIFYRKANAKVGNVIPLRWNEYPFEWVKEKSYTVRRIYSNGPLAEFYGGVELADSSTILHNNENATTVTLFAQFIPANILGYIAMPLVGYKSMKNTLRYLVECVEETKERKGKHQYITKKEAKVNKSLFEERMVELKSYSISPNLLPFLQKHLFQMGDKEVVGMQPYVLARRWNVDKYDVLRMFLYATRIGILKLNWNLICPNCRVSKETHETLFTIKKEQYHCDLCDINYTMNFDQYVELSFSVHPAIRNSSYSTYCVGGPLITPHIHVQKIVEHGKSVVLPYPIHHVDFQIRVLKKNKVIRCIDNELSVKKTPKVSFREDGWEKEIVEMPKGITKLTISNESKMDIIVAMEETSWKQHIVTAAEVTTLSEFRDLFASEVLSPGLRVGIENITIFFSDLKDSTALYEKIGDAQAFGEVRNHFEYLKKWITNNSGSIVKTIGDAVMAVFYSPKQGMQAALDIQNYVKDFNKTQKHKVVIKIGLHSGPAIVINSNDKIDYFGRTVNIASRIQGESEGGDIIISKEFYDRKEVRAVLKAQSIQTSTFSAVMKGAKEESELIRIWPFKNATYL